MPSNLYPFQMMSGPDDNSDMNNVMNAIHNMEQQHRIEHIIITGSNNEDITIPVD